MAVTRSQRAKDTKKKAQEEQERRWEQRQQCRLFKLPGELRNRIYREVLVSDQQIEFTRTGYSRPSLLATNKEIRSEALTIFYHENTFTTEINQYDCASVRSFAASLKSMGLRYRKMNITGTVDYCQPSWKNLLQWIRWHRAREVQWACEFPRVLQKDHRLLDTTMYVTGGMFETAEMTRDKAWDSVERMLTVWRPLLVKIDSKWAEDGK